MKKLILIIIFLIFLTSVSAQDIDIKILNYDPETGNARLQIQNAMDLNDIKIRIDDRVDEIFIAESIKADSSLAFFLIISPGEHTLTITTKQGITSTKKLYFPPNEEQVKKEIEKKRQIAEQEKSQKTLTPITYKKPINYRNIYILAIIIIFIIFYLLYKKFKK